MQCGAAQCRQVVGDQPGRVHHLGARTVRPLQIPAVFALRRPPGDAGQRRQVGRHARAGQRLDQPRVRDQPLVAVAQHLHHEIGVFQRRKAHPDGQIESFADHVHAAVRAFDVDLHARALGHVARQNVRHLVFEQRGRAGQPHDALRLGARALDRLLRRLGFDPHRHAMPVIGLADLGHREAPRRALDQAHAEAFFEQRDAPAQFRLVQVECPRRRRKAAVLDHPGEEVQIVQILHCSGHRALHRSTNGTLKCHFAV